MIADVTAALDAWRVAAIDGSEGRKILLGNVPVVANAQMTAICIEVAGAQVAMKLAMVANLTTLPVAMHLRFTSNGGSARLSVVD